MNKLTILGCGTSTGVPILGCNCKICKSTSVKNKRFRCSALMHFDNDKKILIDTTPDMRTQLLRENIQHLDAAIITHDHADHTHGVDDIRAFCYWRDSDFPIYLNQKTLDTLKIKFSYIFDRKNVFKDKPIIGGGIPMIQTHIVDDQKPHSICEQDFEFYYLPHGYIGNMGFSVGGLGYIVDCKTIPDEIIQKLAQKKLELLILDCNCPKPHQTHLSLDQSIEFAKKIGAKKTRLTHLNHDFDYDELCEKLKAECDFDILPAYDQEVLSF